MVGLFLFFFYFLSYVSNISGGGRHSGGVPTLKLQQNTQTYFCCDSSEVLFNLVMLLKCVVFPQAPNSSESPGTSRTEHSDLLEEEDDERSDIKVKALEKE